MGDMSILTSKAEQLYLLTREAIVHAVWGLDAHAAQLANNASLDETTKRIERAIGEIQGKRNQLSIAEEILDSYRFGESKLSFIIPAGISDADVEALKALNEYSWKRHSHDAALRGELWKFQALPERYPELCERRNPGEPRKVYLHYSPETRVREHHQDVVDESNLQIADVRDIALACAIHRLAYSGATFFRGYHCTKPAATSIPEVGLFERNSGELFLGECGAADVTWGFYAPLSVDEALDREA